MTARWRIHAWLSTCYVLSRVLLHQAGLRFSFSLDWMWMADPADLRDRLFETLFYFHAFPPGANALTGLLLAFGDRAAPAVGQALFWVLGLVLVNALLLLGCAAGLSRWAAFGFSLGFSLAPASIYFEHLYHYEWPVITMLSVAAVLGHRAWLTRRPGVWFAFFTVGAAICVTRSTFHLAWLLAAAGLAVPFIEPGARVVLLRTLLLPAGLVAALYLKNLLLFGDFGASTFGPASYTLVTVDRLPAAERDRLVEQGLLSPFARISVYAPPRQYADFFTTADRPGWPPQLTRLEHRGVAAPNFNHWWLLDVHRTRRSDVLYYLRTRPFEYLANVAEGLRAMHEPSTTWHPRDGTAASPHYRHRQVLGFYEAWFNRLVHGWPRAPIGLYAFLPLLIAWAGVHGWRLARSADRGLQARGVLLLFCAFQIVYVEAASSMLTFLESSRYRFQVEWAIWLLAAVAIANGVSRARAALVR